MKNITTCLNCNTKFELIKIFTDKLGKHTKCPKCNSTFDINLKEIDICSFCKYYNNYNCDLEEKGCQLNYWEEFKNK